MSIKVGVRVRPFNNRELQMNERMVVQMEGNKTILFNQNGDKKEFIFDYSLWSFDGFQVDSQTGYSQKVNDKYVDQRELYDIMGRQILDNCLQGYHCCLFAYGQTGSGKSYSMMGSQQNRGIIPTVLDEIFQSIQQNQSPNRYFVKMSMLEIYNEKVHDLLVDVKERKQQGLKVREHKQLGIFIEGLTKYEVKSFKQIQSLIEQGNKNRSIASTLMNSSSSRAHTIVQIELKQLNEHNLEKSSIINLVDLAGSERTAKTGAEGDRFKEGVKINLSLSVLGQVINDLAQKAAGSNKNSVTPYRNSVLTRILQDNLGGNSKTVMICSISPALDNYDETLSTLRYADQAKRIKQNAVVNETSQDKLIRQLQQENQELKVMLQKLQNNKNSNDNENILQRIEMNQQYLENLCSNQKCKQEYLDVELPYISNVHEDSQLSDTIRHSIDKDITKVGKKGNEMVRIDLQLNGMGINLHHCNIIRRANRYFIDPLLKQNGEYLYVNGYNVYQVRELLHNDRIIIGLNNIFVVKLQKDFKSFEYEFIQEEFQTQQKIIKQQEFDKIQKEQQEEIERLKQEMQEMNKIEIDEMEKQMAQQTQDYEKKVGQLRQELENQNKKEQWNQIQRELEKEDESFNVKYIQLQQEKDQTVVVMQKVLEQIKDEEINSQQRINIRKYLHRKLVKYIPKIQEVNYISKELGRRISFDISLEYFYLNDSQCMNLKKVKNFIQVNVKNYEEQQQYQWTLSKFNNRYFIIKDIFSRYLNSSVVPQLDKNADPYWDPPQVFVVGYCMLLLQSIVYCQDNLTTLQIVGNEGVTGFLEVKIVMKEKEQIKDIYDNYGKNIRYSIEIGNFRLDNDNYSQLFVEYNHLDKSYKTGSLYTGNQPEGDFNYKKQYDITEMTEELIQKFNQTNVNLSIYCILLFYQLTNQLRWY